MDVIVITPITWNLTEVQCIYKPDFGRGFMKRTVAGRSYGPCKKLAFILFDNNIETDIDIQNHSLVRIHEI